mmetsp:Transcript_33126/g.60753  ORF Transcript_33126/g.60753 Transcript_33126/m.60753 type:complete len:101 (-) Transcript_33126:469-771(-)
MFWVPRLLTRCAWTHGILATQGTSPAALHPLFDATCMKDVSTLQLANIITLLKLFKTDMAWLVTVSAVAQASLGISCLPPEPLQPLLRLVHSTDLMVSVN